MPSIREVQSLKPIEALNFLVAAVAAALLVLEPCTTIFAGGTVYNY
jgi:hypothetical protein